MKHIKKFKINTLGCRTNQYESAAYAKQLLDLGYEEAKEGEEAEVCIVNTCTVTHSADRTSRYQIRSLARDNPNSRLVVTGCLAERLPDEIKGIDGVTDVVSNRDKENLMQTIFPDLETYPEFRIDQFADRTRAFVKIQDGCNSFCTYCIIPYVRGRSRSRTAQSIVDEIEGLIAQGYKEVVLTGINIGDYDGGVKKGEKPVSLAELVRQVDRIEGLERLRLSSIDPDEVDEDLRNALLQGKTTCQSMHVVLQAGSNAVLKKMNRKYTKQEFMHCIDHLRTLSDDFTFTTDIIVGFPGESDQDFQETLDMMDEVQFAKVHMFPFSARKRTRAALYTNQISEEVKQERKSELLRKAEKIAYDLRERFVGRTLKVLFEAEESAMPGYISGHTDNFLKVFVPLSAGVQSNDIAEVFLESNSPLGLIGSVC